MERLFLRRGPACEYLLFVSDSSFVGTWFLVACDYVLSCSDFVNMLREKQADAPVGAGVSLC